MSGTEPDVTETGDDPRLEMRNLIAACMVEEGDGVALPPQGVERLEAAVDAVLDSTVLLPVVDATLVIAHFVETDLSSPDAAKKLTDIVNRETVLDSMKRLGELLKRDEVDRARDAAAGLAALTEHRVSIEMTAPAVDAEAPDGSVKLDSLDFPKRL